MIIAAQYLDAVQTALREEHDRLQNLDNLPPGRFRLSVRLPGADEIQDALLKIALYIQQAGEDSPYVEASRLMLNRHEARGLNSFDTIFETRSQFNVRLDFMVSHISSAGEHGARIGMAFAKLGDLVQSKNERLDADLWGLNGAKVPEGFVELRMQWLRFKNERVVIEAHVRILRNSGWPFGAARPFFVLYKWEQPVRRWIPIYRSEVLTKGGTLPNSKGVMKYEVADIPAKKTLGGDYDRPLRLEFFHYKAKGKPKMLGFLETSLSQLRQTKPGVAMDLKLSTFAEGELVGALKMVNSKISTGRIFFHIQATFGGDVPGNFVFFDIGLTDVKERRGWKRGSDKMFYTIARYGDSNVWEKIYRSEAAQRLSGKLYRYQVARVSERRLNECRVTRPISLMLFKGVGGKRVPIGHVETSVESLRSAPPGATLTLQGDSGSQGHVRIDQVEEKEGLIYFGLQCVLQERDGLNNSTEVTQQVVSV